MRIIIIRRRKNL